MLSLISQPAERLAVSAREAATLVGCSVETIRAEIRAGKLKAGRPGGDGDLRILVSDLEQWLRGDGRYTPRPPANAFSAPVTSTGRPAQRRQRMQPTAAAAEPPAKGLLNGGIVPEGTSRRSRKGHRRAA